jgi:aldehyde dehydrogenase (NAD+)
VQPIENFIAGQFVPSRDTRTRTHHDPSDRASVVSVVARGSGEDVEEAVGAASTATRDWNALGAATRGDYLYRWSATIAADAERLAQAIMREVGKPVSEARGEVARCSAILRYYAGEAVHPMGEVIPSQVAGALQYSVREALGVVALITPWNFPMAIPLWKAAPALAFGNTVVLKSSEYSPLCASLLAQAAREAGLPPGVFNVLHGEGAIVGESLLAHPEVRGVSFTGSQAVGSRVAAVASARNIRYQTEMGGKNVAIVLDDADLNRAAALAASGGVRYAGQKCTATSRVVVQRGVADQFNEALQERMGELMIGPVTDAHCAVGPLIHAAARDKVLGFLSGVSGADVIGGQTPDGGELGAGNYITPALVRGVRADSNIAQEEIFGPVVVSFVAEDIEEAIAIANNTRFGLSASLFTSNISGALRYISGIQAGMVRVNADTTGVDPHAPFGGMKSSSSGTREQGPAARDFYTATKTVQINP